MWIKRLLIIVFGCFMCCSLLCAQVNFTGKEEIIGQNISVLVDAKNSFSPNTLDTQNNGFEKSHKEIPTFSNTHSTYWIKFSIRNLSTLPGLMLELGYPLLDSSRLFYKNISSGNYEEVLVHQTGRQSQSSVHQYPVYLLNIKKDSTASYLLKISGAQIVLPLVVRTEDDFWFSSLNNLLLIGIYVGLMAVMILYNIFVYLSTRDKTYFYYVCYVFFIALTQITLSGFAYKYFWPNKIHYNSTAAVVFSALSGISAIVFFKDFLHTSEKMPKVNKYLNLVAIVYTVALMIRLAGVAGLSFRMLDIAGLGATLFGLGISIKLSLDGYRPAKYFLLAWSIFLVGLSLFVMRNLNILPYNIFTSSTMQAGTAIEVVLLSFALADKINILKKEKEEEQAKVLDALKKNEEIITGQNVMLEKMVGERTQALEIANEELNSTLQQLKDAQAQLINSEKMASLGQLTAGIAHEINNPINFVSSNIKPLRKDIDDLLEMLDGYGNLQQVEDANAVSKKLEEMEQLKKDLDIDYIKEEISTLLLGMEEGAGRTVEIIRGLKNFSRVDESDSNYVNINEGIESTLVILNSQFGSKITLIKELGELPNIHCYAGKLNQVFMNILSNSLDALQNSGSNGTPTVWVKSWQDGENSVTISIKDNGPGMSNAVKAKIFDPFFTTKEVGKGTGLGLSIVFKIIESHKGKIQVISETDKGAEFVIQLPVSPK